MKSPYYQVSIFNPGMKTFEKYGIKLNGIQIGWAPEQAPQWYQYILCSVTNIVIIYLKNQG
jgi:hypothetical protein